MVIHVDKYELRKEFFKLKYKNHSYSQCRKILKAKFGYDVTVRTLKRWVKRLEGEEWDLEDRSRRPHTIHYKMTPEIEEEILNLRKNFYIFGETEE